MRSVIKRLIAIFCAGIMLFAVLSFGFVGCGDAEQKRIEELEAELSERNDALKEYFDGEILSLSLAYDLGIVSRDDLLSIAYYNNGGNMYNEDIMPKDYAPKEKTLVQLGDDHTELLKQKEEERARAEYTEEYYLQRLDRDEQSGLPIKRIDYETFIDKGLSRVKINDYYGTYNGCVAFSYNKFAFIISLDIDIGSGSENLGVGAIVDDGEISKTDIDGITFRGYNTVYIWVFK